MNHLAQSAIESLIVTLRRKLEDRIAIQLRRSAHQDGSERSLCSLHVHIGETGHADYSAG